MTEINGLENNGIDSIINTSTGTVHSAVLEQIKKPSPHSEQYGKVTLGPGGQRDLATAKPPSLFALPKLTVAQRTSLENARKYALTNNVLMRNAVQSAAALVGARVNLISVSAQIQAPPPSG